MDYICQMVLLATASIICENSVSKKRYCTAVASASSLQRSFDRYRDRVKEAFAVQAKKKVYIHRGADAFNPDLMKPIKNEWHKPKGHTGLWASPIDAERGWLEWCEAEHFQIGPLDKFFRFTIAEPEKILYVHDLESTKLLVRKYYIPRPYDDPLTAEQIIAILDNGDTVPPTINLDFEAMERDGWVGLEINLSEYYKLYWLLYGWDCDSIVVFDKSQVEILD